MVCTHKISARWGLFGQVESVVIKISFIGGGWPYFGLRTHTRMTD